MSDILFSIFLCWISQCRLSKKVVTFRRLTRMLDSIVPNYCAVLVYEIRVNGESGINLFWMWELL